MFCTQKWTSVVYTNQQWHKRFRTWAIVRKKWKKTVFVPIELNERLLLPPLMRAHSLAHLFGKSCTNPNTISSQSTSCSYSIPVSRSYRITCIIWLIRTNTLWHYLWLVLALNFIYTFVSGKDCVIWLKKKSNAILFRKEIIFSPNLSSATFIYKKNNIWIQNLGRLSST